MSKKWTPELDAILLQGVFEECQVSFGKALCEKLAERIRAAGVDGFTECTPKSIENRLYAWKKKTMATGTGDSALATPKKIASKQTATPKTKTPRAKKGIAKKMESEGTPSKGRKRAAESEEGAEQKKVKAESSGDEDAEVAEEEEEEEEV